MTVRDAAVEFSLPAAAIKVLQSEGVVGQDLTERDQLILAGVAAIWEKSQFLRMQLSGFSRLQRQRFLESAPLGRAEAYVYYRYANLPKGEKLLLRDVISEVTSRFGFVPAPTALKSLRAAKKKGQNRRDYLIRRRSG